MNNFFSFLAVCLLFPGLVTSLFYVISNKLNTMSVKYMKTKYMKINNDIMIWMKKLWNK